MSQAKKKAPTRLANITKKIKKKVVSPNSVKVCSCCVRSLRYQEPEPADNQVPRQAPEHDGEDKSIVEPPQLLQPLNKSPVELATDQIERDEADSAILESSPPVQEVLTSKSGPIISVKLNQQS